MPAVVEKNQLVAQRHQLPEPFRIQFDQQAVAPCPDDSGSEFRPDGANFAPTMSGDGPACLNLFARAL
ncbi:hypothetical protein [Neorhizobium vignae]|uniref:hypothetical protein n=1 Tax=Neorhizobium vignae TaxID=690585 RepID=UPI00056BE23C|nr:hypothetical protein [Neorhizobium vignae]